MIEEDDKPKRLLLVDDSSAVFGERVNDYSGLRGLTDLRHPSWVLKRLADPQEAAALLRPYQVMVIDAFWHDRDVHEDPVWPHERPASRFVALEIVGALRRIPSGDRPIVVVFSSLMDRPEVNIPLWERRFVVAARYRACDLLAELEDGTPVISKVARGEVPQAWRDPVDDDYATLDLTPGAHIARLVETFLADGRLWYRAATKRTPPGHTTEAVSKAIGRLSNSAGLGGGGSTRAVNLVRRVTRLEIPG